MPERPLLVLPRPGQPVERAKRRGFPSNINRPSRQRQGERLTPRFAALQQAIESHRARFQLDAQALVPEDVVVLETVGAVDNFVQAVDRISGMEWLAEIEEVDMPPDDDFFVQTRAGERTDQSLGGRLFMVFTNQTALGQLLSLWGSWQAKRPLRRGFGPWATLFSQLRDVRRWGVRDRLHETGVLDDWRERVQYGEEVVPCEIELWHRGSLSGRNLARNRVATLVEHLGGTILAEATISEIAYQTLLANLPVPILRNLLEEGDDDIDLVQCEQIQFIRASGQMAALPTDDAGGQDHQDEAMQSAQMPTKPPSVALLDGLPLQAHRLLQGRLSVDDPDDFETNYPANQRVHGTSMASLIVHGDLAAAQPPLPSRLYVRPILHPDPKDWRNHRERVPESTLTVDLLHRAVRRLFEGEGDEPAAAPSIAVINLSIGIGDRPFAQAMSPLAKLLDWLAWRYKVLFVVSAGNHTQPICLTVGATDLDAMDDAAIEREVLQAVAADARHRRLLSPAESLNALTVGSTHADSSNGESPNWIDPLEIGLPSPINAQGMGFRRAVKPDVLAPGGRVALVKPLIPAASSELEIYTQAFKPGQRVAAPGPALGDVSGIRYARGTSNATALVSRAGAFLQEVLDDLRSGPDGNVIDDIPRAVWLKAMIAHGADWGLAGAKLKDILGNPSNRGKFKEYVTRLLGYGTVDADRVRECTPWRVTAISGGALGEDESHIHAFPLPPSLSGLRIHKRLTITLAWFSPVNPRHQAWRRAQLWFEPPKDELRVKRLQADYRAVRRGTLQHEILEGKAAAFFDQGRALEIQVSCRADAGVIEENVPYALVATLEVAEDLALDIYDEVRTAVQAARLRV